MEGRYLYLRKHDQLIAKVSMTKNRMFILNIKYVVTKCLSACMKDDTWLWHLRFGHVNFGSLKFLSSKVIVKGLPLIENTPEGICEGCIIEKHSRASFPKKSFHQARRLLELIHTDIYGPITPASFGGRHYFLTFIDDFNRKIWVYLLKEKREALEIFKKFKALVENQTGCKIKALRSNRGGEIKYLEIKSRYLEDFDCTILTPAEWHSRKEESDHS